MRDPIPRTGNYQLDRLKKMSMTDTKPNFHLRNGKKEIIAKSSLKVNTVFIVSVPYFRHIQTSFKTKKHWHGCKERRYIDLKHYQS